MSTNLLFCKSKVYVHPTKNSQDNIPGYLLITKDAQQPPQSAIVTWIPERELDKLQLNQLNRAESALTSNSSSKNLKLDKNLVLQAMYITWAFSIELASIYSIQFRLPSPSGWWFGSIIINSKSPQEQESIPVLFFHDNVCSSTQERQKQLSKSFDPFTNSNEIYWGGDDFRDAIGKICDLQKTAVDPQVWLVNPTLDDLRNFSTSANKAKKDDKFVESGPGFWESFERTRWNLMSKIADATTKTTSTLANVLKQHPIAKLADKHSNNPYVKKMLTDPKVQEIQNDFDSAKIYLAKWALGVKEQAERYQTSHGLDDNYRKWLSHELGVDSTGDVDITEEEMNIALQRCHPLTKQKWDSLFDSQGRLSITVHEVKDYIFHGGVKDMDLRKEVWLFLLEVYPWDSSRDEREQLDSTLKEIYETSYKSKWINRQPHDEESEESYWQDQVFRIEKDVKRNDRHMDLYKYNTEDGAPPQNATESSNENEDDPEEEDEGWHIKNPHLNSLRSILISYNIYNDDLGYVQGMTDLLSPIYYVLRDESLSFWCFVHFMDRMERNFLRDQSGIRDQMLTLTELCQLMLPKLSQHLGKCDSSNLFFCFRMLLVWFKREFEFDEVCSIWEIFLTDFYSSQFQLFFMLAILQKNSSPVINHLTQFDQVLKYFNDLKASMDWNDLMVRSELLFIKFRKLIELIERKTELNNNVTNDGAVVTGSQTQSAGAGGLLGSTEPVISSYMKQLLSKKVVIQREGPRSSNSIK